MLDPTIWAWQHTLQPQASTGMSLAFLFQLKQNGHNKYSTSTTLIIMHSTTTITTTMQMTNDDTVPHKQQWWP
jgi:hypothetical protein